MNSRKIKRKLSESDNLRAEKIKKTVESATFTHVTREENLSNILETGLDPNKGGKNGASQAAGSEHFIKTSTGYVHLGNDTQAKPGALPSSEFYSDFFTNNNIPSAVLHTVVSPQQKSQLLPDPYDDQGGRYKTQIKIESAQIHTVKPFSSPALPNGRFLRPAYAPPSILHTAQAHFPRGNLVTQAEIYSVMIGDTSKTKSYSQQVAELKQEEKIERQQHAEKQMEARRKYSNGSSQFYRAQKAYDLSPAHLKSLEIVDYTGPDTVHYFKKR